MRSFEPVPASRLERSGAASRLCSIHVGRSDWTRRETCSTKSQCCLLRSVSRRFRVMVERLNRNPMTSMARVKPLEIGVRAPRDTTLDRLA